jgi:hypothetical protein
MMILLVLSIVDAAVDFNNLQDSVTRYNNNIENAPAVLKAFMGNERINMTILMHNRSIVVWGIETENAKIIRYSLGGVKSPTIDEYACEDAINEVLSAEDSLAVFHESEMSGRIKIEGETPEAKIKLAAMLSSGEAIKYYFGMFD